MKQFISSRIYLRFKRYYFNPRWSLTVFTFVGLSFFITLGFWQLTRAHVKELLHANYHAQLTQAPLTLDQLPSNPEALRYHAIKISGYYDTTHSFLLDNKMHNHRPGYEVLTPMILDQPLKGPAMIIVNRGWIPVGPARNQLPIIPPVSQHQILQGMIYVPLGKPFMLGNAVESSTQWPLRLQGLDLTVIAQALDQQIYPFIMLLSPEEKQGFVRDWQPVTMPAHKHVGYAVQWFTFAVVLIIIFIALNTHKSTGSKNKSR